MGENSAPKKFTRADKRICMRGLLQLINLDATENEVRKGICDVIRSKPELAEYNTGDLNSSTCVGSKLLCQIALLVLYLMLLNNWLALVLCMSVSPGTYAYQLLPVMKVYPSSSVWKKKTVEENLSFGKKRNTPSSTSDSRDPMCSQNLDRLSPVNMRALQLLKHPHPTQVCVCVVFVVVVMHDPTKKPTRQFWRMSPYRKGIRA